MQFFSILMTWKSLEGSCHDGGSISYPRHSMPSFQRVFGLIRPGTDCFAEAPVGFPSIIIVLVALYTTLLQIHNAFTCVLTCWSLDSLVS